MCDHCLASQLLPFVYDAPHRADASGDEATDSAQPTVEPWMPSILAHFDGCPSVTDEGDIVYVFPELLPTTTRDTAYGLYPRTAPVVVGANRMLKSLSGPTAQDDYLAEPLLTFTSRSGDAGKVWAVALANTLGMIALGAALGPLQVALLQRRRALAIVNILYGSLLVNGGLWLVVPAWRRLLMLGANIRVRLRNGRRRRFAASLTAPFQPAPLARKLRAARALGRRGRQEVLRAGDVPYYTTGKSLLEQREQHDPQLERWDDALQARTRGGDGGDGAGRGKKGRSRRPEGSY